MLTSFSLTRVAGPLGALLCLAVVLRGYAAVGRPPSELLPRHWIDEQGRAFELPVPGGGVTVFTMAYASCHRICPRTMSRLGQIQERLDRQQVPAEFVIVGYDPETDDPAAWRQYRRARGLSRPNWHFLSGSPQQVARFARLLGFEFWTADRHVLHDERIVLLDPARGLLIDPDPEALSRVLGSGVQP